MKLQKRILNLAVIGACAAAFAAFAQSPPGQTGAAPDLIVTTVTPLEQGRAKGGYVGETVPPDTPGHPGR